MTIKKKLDSKKVSRDLMTKNPEIQKIGKASKYLSSILITSMLFSGLVAGVATTFISVADANCAFGDNCKADSVTGTGDANNPKSYKNTGTVSTKDKCFPNKEQCPN